MSRLSLLERYNSLAEEIHAREAYTDKGALRTIIKGKRDVGVIDLSKNFIPKLEKYDLGVIPLRMTSQNTIYSIVYRDKEKAYRLYDIVKKKGGYLADNTPDEAREIGKLLGYSDLSITEYIRKKYGRKALISHEKTPDDYDDLDESKINKRNLVLEQSIKKFLKQVKKDINTGDLNKFLLFKGEDFSVYAVNGEAVRDNGFDEWVDGGHYYVDSNEKNKKYAKFIPEDEIWIDDVFIIKPNDLAAIILHEKLERYLMKHLGFSYSTNNPNKPGAHEIANQAEELFRKKVPTGMGNNISEKIYKIFIEHYKDKSPKKRLSESINKTKKLLQKVNSYLIFHWLFL